MGKIPKNVPPVSFKKRDWTICGTYPAKEVGGDLYDYFILEEKLYFIIGDVSGKGIPASLLMAVTRSLFRTVSLHYNTAAEIMADLISRCRKIMNQICLFPFLRVCWIYGQACLNIVMQDIILPY
jgi:hypothetical protein